MKSQNEKMRQVIVIVYLNSQLPKYAIKNLDYLSKTFPMRDIFLVTDNTDNLKTALKLGIKSFEVAGMNNLWPEVTKVTAQPRNFRKGFWISTLIRFKAIELFIRYHEFSQVIQIEADVLLMPNFPFEEIGNFCSRISYPLVSEELAAASIFIANDLNAIVRFNSKIEQLINENPNHSDMSALAVISREDPDLVSILPTIPDFVKAPDKLLTDIYSRMSSNYKFFGGIFDAATWGMYFLGTDPRNRRGLKTLGIDFDSHSLKASSFKFRKEKYSGILVSNKDTRDFTLYNLHIHCKSIQLFDFNRQKYPLWIYESFNKVGIKYLFSTKIFLLSILNKINKYCRIAK
jgi:hypothetical protein